MSDKKSTDSTLEIDEFDHQEETAELSESSVKSEHSDSTTCVFHHATIVRTLPSFDIYEVSGFNWEVGVRIYEQNEKTKLIFAMGHVLTLLDITTHERQSIFIHENSICDTTIDRRGRFIITADAKTAIVWDLKCPEGNEPLVVLRSFEDPFKSLSISHVAISASGRYAIIVSSVNKNKEHIIQFWMWSFGKKHCDGEGRVNSEQYGIIKDLRFSDNKNEEEFFVISMSRIAIFGYWDSTNATLIFHIPNSKRFNSLTKSCYITNTTYVVSGTTHGNVAIWTDLQHEIYKLPITNKKDLFKVIPVKNCSINDIRMIDEYVAMADDSGEIRFYDKNIHLLHYIDWLTTSPIQRIICVPAGSDSFCGRKENLSSNLIASTTPKKQIVPKRKRSDPLLICESIADSDSNDFKVRNFLIATKAGEIIFCNIMENLKESVLERFDDIYVAVDHHPTLNLIIKCNASGNVSYINYVDYKKIAEFEVIPLVPENADINEPKPECTILKISPCGRYVAFGLSDGQLHLIDTITGNSILKKFLTNTKSPINLISFGQDVKYISYADENSSVGFIYYDQKWEFIGKFRYHCKKIVNVIFVQIEKKLELITIGEDSILAEYDVRQSINQKRMVLVRDVRLEQTAKITAAILAPASVLKRDSSTEGKVILTANNEYKFRIFDTYNLDCLYTIQGPLYESPIHHIIFNASQSTPLLIVASKKTLATAYLPLDGNPFRFSGFTVHPKQIDCICSANAGNFVVVQGAGDYGCTIWKLNMDNVIEYFKSGGEGLLPFCTLLPGGQDGWLFREMQDFFYLMQLMHDSLDRPKEFDITDSMNVSDMIDFLRAVGYFPSEWEIKNIKIEVSRTAKSLQIEPSKISFSNIVQIYLNHKPVDGYKLNDIMNAVKHIVKEKLRENEAENSEEGEDDAEDEISMEKILDLLSEKGESVTKQQAMKYIVELMGPLTEEDEKYEYATPVLLETEMSKLPLSFNILSFCKTLLGIEVQTDSKNNLYSVFGEEIDPSKIESQLKNDGDNFDFGEKFEEEEEEEEEVEECDGKDGEEAEDSN